MRRAIVVVFAAALAVSGADAVGPPGPVTLTGELSASLGGVIVAAGGFEATIADGEYRVSGYGRTAGVGRMFSNGEARVESSGRLSQAALRPAGYRHELKQKRDADVVAIAFAGERVESVAIVPPPKPRSDRVPLAEQHLRKVFDPLSAVMQLSAGPAAPELCERTLPIFDGEQRYDVELSFKRMDDVGSPRGGYSGPAYVCAIRYRPIAGHRPTRSGVKFLQKVEGMEIWLAEIGEGVVAPVRARVPTPFGPLVVSATRLSLR